MRSSNPNSASSSFKRRIPTKSLELAPGLRSSPSSSASSSQLPLFSTGLTALDDLISGRGHPSASSLCLLPSTNTASTLRADPDEDTDLKRSTSEPYTELILAYGIAQGLVANHKVILVGHDLNGFSKGIMAKIGEEEQTGDTKTNSQSGDFQDGEDEEDDRDNRGKNGQSSTAAPLDSKGEKMDIAWRYEKMRQFKTSIDSTSRAGQKLGDEQDLFCSVYDLSRRISSLKLENARMNGNLEFISIDHFSQQVGVSGNENSQPDPPDASKRGQDQLDDEDLAWKSERQISKQKQREPENELKDMNSFDLAFERISGAVEKALRKARERSPTSPPPQPIRICLRSLGSPSWKVKPNQNRSAEAIKFLSRLKVLLRNTSFQSVKDKELLGCCQVHPSFSSSTSSTPAPNSAPTSNSNASLPHANIPTILTSSISSHLLSTTSNPSTTTLSQILSQISDSTILFSNFQISKFLRDSFPSYTGGIKILKTPRLGTLLDSSIKTSILRGMGNTLNSLGDGRGGTGSANVEGGTGGTENNLAFKLKRKKFVVETLHLDVEKEDNKKKKEKEKEKSKEEEAKHQNIDERRHEGRPELLELNQGSDGRSFSHPVVAPSNSTNGTTITPATSTSTPLPTPPGQVNPPKSSFGGLKALRQRGLAEQNRNQASSPASPSRTQEVSVGIDDGSSSHHRHDHPKHTSQKSKNGIQTPVFKSDKMKDYEF